jgi:hypothetical protein
MEKLTDAVNNPARFTMFKAVVVPAAAVDGNGNVDQDEIIVGYTQWMLGYLETPKVDPFAPKDQSAGSGTTTTFEANILNVATSEYKEKQAGGVVAALEAIDLDDTSNQSKPYYSNPDQEHSRIMGNAYIRAIRGKRHLCEYFHIPIPRRGSNRLQDAREALTDSFCRSPPAHRPSFIPAPGHRPEAAGLGNRDRR